MPEEKKVTLSVQELIQIYEQQKSQLNSFELLKRNINSSIIESLTALEALKEIKNSKKDNELLVSIGAGAFLNTKIESIKKIKLLIGTNTVKEFPLTNVKKKIEEKKALLEKELKKLLKEEGKLLQSIQGLEKMLIKIQREQLKKREQKNNSSQPAIIS